MSLKDDLIKAKVEGLKSQGISEDLINIEKDSTLDIEAELTKEAIVNFLNNSEFRITEMRAPVTIENFNIPEQSVNVAPETLMGPYAPLLKALQQLAILVPGGENLMNTFDFINQKYGKSSLRIASEGIEKKWLMKRNKCSSNYTTNIKELLTVQS